MSPRQSTFVDPSSLSLPSSSKRATSPPSRLNSPDMTVTHEPPRKRPRSAMTPEERKEARAHRNRIAAQNSRDRRKAQFTYLERRVTELEEENRRLRAGLPASPSPSISGVSVPEVITIEREQELKRKQAEEQRERENEELRERIRTLEKGYEAVVRALEAQGKALPALVNVPTSPADSPSHVVPSSPTASSSDRVVSPAPGDSSLTLSPSSPNPSTLTSLAPTFPLSPAPTHSTLADSPLAFADESLDFSFTPMFSPLTSGSTLLDSPKEPLDRALSSDAPTRHLARVATTPGFSGVALQRVGSVPPMTRFVRVPKRSPVVQSWLPEDETASDAIIARLLAEIIASPVTGAGALPGVDSSPEETPGTEILSTTNTVPLRSGLGFGPDKTGMDNIDWVEQAPVGIGLEMLLEMLPTKQNTVSIDAQSTPTNPDVDMDLANLIMWDGVSVS
ncbi:hypothetical protein ID866_4875 [Astraeus odoratus]|nr:hypothetical protein ID866_4875 [Astraeus odoratus]